MTVTGGRCRWTGRASQTERIGRSSCKDCLAHISLLLSFTPTHPQVIRINSKVFSVRIEVFFSLGMHGMVRTGPTHERTRQQQRQRGLQPTILFSFCVFCVLCFLFLSDDVCVCPASAPGFGCQRVRHSTKGHKGVSGEGQEAWIEAFTRGRRPKRLEKSDAPSRGRFVNNSWAAPYRHLWS